MHFPDLFRLKALGNLIPQSIFMRALLGLASMFASFWAVFVLLFLD